MGVFEDIRCWLHLQLLLLFHCVCLCGRESSRGWVLEWSHLPHIEIFPLARSPSEGRSHFCTFEARPKIETSRGLWGIKCTFSHVIWQVPALTVIYTILHVPISLVGFYFLLITIVSLTFIENKVYPYLITSFDFSYIGDGNTSWSRYSCRICSMLWSLSPLEHLEDDSRRSFR